MHARGAGGARGFTLIETLVVMALAAVLLAVAVPNLRPQVAAAHAKSTASQLADALRYARQYALNTSTLVTFTPSGCGYTVATTAGTQLLSASSGASSGVSCQALSQTVSFLGDGSVALCTQGAQGLSCSPAGANSTATVSGGGSNWQIVLSPGGVVTTSGS
ncbi:Tfp pilus assembly protein FimT/FimU [Thiomonas sp. FB-6]|uniref:pilus assembly FimT family protein n=1 Tax=Thiomonas sp. FB-6 TaxID=1158291 RepID=UPI0003620EC6|nr:GspH/FimT family pseudopilin [Thiomonas sp. FB-6]